MLTKEEILKQVQQLLTEAFELEARAVTPEAHLYRDLDLDSFDAIDLAISMEVIKLQEEELKSIRTVSDIVEIVYPKYNS
jgi:acyl carrier protein